MSQAAASPHVASYITPRLDITYDIMLPELFSPIMCLLSYEL